MAMEISFDRSLEKRRKALDLTHEKFNQKVGCIFMKPKHTEWHQNIHFYSILTKTSKN